MQSKPHGQNSAFSLGAGRDWMNTRQNRSLKLLGRWSPLEARGFAWSWKAPTSCMAQLFAPPEIQADLRAAYMSQNQTLQSLLQLPFPSPRSLKVTAEGGLLTSQSVPLSSHPWAGSQLCLSQTGFVPLLLPLSLTLLLWPWSASFYKSLRRACSYKDCLSLVQWGHTSGRTLCLWCDTNGLQ